MEIVFSCVNLPFDLIFWTLFAVPKDIYTENRFALPPNAIFVRFIFSPLWFWDVDFAYAHFLVSLDSLKVKYMHVTPLDTHHSYHILAYLYILAWVSCWAERAIERLSFTSMTENNESNYQYTRIESIFHRRNGTNMWGCRRYWTRFIYGIVLYSVRSYYSQYLFHRMCFVTCDGYQWNMA